jgi:ureidoglycolate lyase
MLRDVDMSGKFLAIEVLTKANFAPFGIVIETGGATQIEINQGTTTRFDALADCDNAYQGGTPIISLFRGTPRADPIAIKLMERHPRGSQAFFPLSPEDWLVVVAPTNADDTGPDFAKLRCFRANGHQGVSYARGTWHHPLLVLAPVQDFLVIDRKAPAGEAAGANLDEVWVPGDGVAALIQP